MHFIQIIGYTVQTGKAKGFQDWLADNEGAWASAMPEGTEYIGTFAAVMGTNKHAGTTYTLYRLDSYGALDRLAAAMKDGALGKIISDSAQFVDWESDDWSQLILKAMGEATLIE